MVALRYASSLPQPSGRIP